MSLFESKYPFFARSELSNKPRSSSFLLNKIRLDCSKAKDVFAGVCKEQFNNLTRKDASLSVGNEYVGGETRQS